MRYLAAFLTVCTLSVAHTAFAQEATPIPNPEKPAPTAVVPAAPMIKKAAAAKPATDTSPNPDASLSDEPNLKVTKNSGGKSTSSIITGAPLSSDFVMGEKSAPVTIIEYVSMSCPHCAHFSNTVLPELERKYIRTGKVRYILRQFPLNEPALKGAELLDCVGEQDSKKYFTFAKVLFDAQNKWAFDGNFLAGLETIANVGGLSKEQFANCINNTDREMRVLKLKKEADDELKVPHTPYMFIDSEVYEGERTIEALSQFIDAKLAQESKKGVIGHAVDHVLDRL